MQAVIVHLTDIHLQSNSDPIVKRVDAMKRAILSQNAAIDSYFIAISGDIANKGEKLQYDIALSVFHELKRSLHTAGVAQVEFVIVPGNHDCDLADEVDTRPMILRSMDEFISKPIVFDGLSYDAVMSVQSNFFDFEAKLTGNPRLPEKGRLYYKRSYSIGTRTISFHCFNTAWLSQRHEIQAKLYIPPEILRGDECSADVGVAVFHHPYNWINSNNYRTFKSFVDTSADFALTGHEHIVGGIREANLNGATIEYIQGSALRDPETGDSAFQVIAIDCDASTQCITHYRWIKDRFSQTHKKTSALNRNDKRRQIPFLNNSLFVTELHAMGAGLHHPRCTPPYCRLKLRDLYVYPTLRHRNFNYKVDNETQACDEIEGEKLWEFVRAKKKVIIYGADDTGKTALARILYDDLRSSELIPLLLTGDDLKSKIRQGQLTNVVAEAVTRQYASLSTEPFEQLDRTERLLIIDDFDKARFTKANQETAITHFGEVFGTVVIFASDVMQLQDLACGNEHSPLREFEFCILRDFGKYHRHKLIHKWLYLGREDSHEFESLGMEVIEKDKTVSTLLGRNVLPHTPLTILTLLQLLESGETPNTANGSYGYLYEVLIKNALSRVGRGASDVDAKITYLSGVGFQVFAKRQPYLTEEEFRNAHDKYLERYDMLRDFSQMSAELKASEVLTESNGNFRFKYPYIYYYAVAKYLHDNSAAMRQELDDLADHTYNEVNANVLIFYVYLTKDTRLIKRVIENAKCIFAELSPCTLEDSATVRLNKMFKTVPPPLELVCSNSSSNRDDYNRKLDKNTPDYEEDVVNDVQIKYDQSLEEIVKIQIAFKTLQILGQVLRNFTGSLERDVKLEITRECYKLGMRVLGLIVSYSGTDLADLRQYVGSLIAERTGVSDQKELASRTDSAILWLSGVAAFACIKRISYAVGHADLARTYTRVLNLDSSLSTQIIDATIKLDHFPRIPAQELSGLRGKVHNNPFARGVMQDLVAEYLYLYNNDTQTRQSLGSQWNIKVLTPKMISNSSKR